MLMKWLGLGDSGDMRVSIFSLRVKKKKKSQLKKELNDVICRMNILINILVYSGEVYVGWNHSGNVKEQRSQI